MPTAPGRILITGAGGFVGRHLMAALASAFPAASLLMPEFDVSDSAAVDRIVHDAAPDVCIHLAAISTNARAVSDLTHAWNVNVHGTLYLARALLRQNPTCQLLFVSSADAYGDSFRHHAAVNETVPLAPLNAYAATKAAADLALGAMVEEGLNVVRLRPFNHTGPGQSSGLVVAAFARQVARIKAGLQEPVINVGNIEARRDFLDVRDVCTAYVACVTQRDRIASGTILNLASGEPRRIGDVLDELKQLAGLVAEIRTDPARTRATDVKLARGDASRARLLLGWTPKIAWHQTLVDVLDDWQHRLAAEPESA